MSSSEAKVENGETKNGEASASSPAAETASPGPPKPKLPEWLKAELFEGFLKEQIKDFKKIQNFNAKPALGPGENYATLMIRIEIDVELQDGKSKSVSYMMKLPIETPLFREFMQKHNVFDTEDYMYQTVIPEMEQMYRDAGVTIKFGAEAYKIQTPSEFGVILLEDLRPRGYKNTNRLEGLDMDHTQRTLKRLAQWHAASATRVEMKGKYNEDHTKGFFDDSNREMMKEMNGGIIKYFMTCVPHYQGNEDYIDKIKKLVPNVVDLLYETPNIALNEFKVLNHGDVWSNNVMFQYDAFGKIKDTVLIDYQVPRYGTPIQDLLYFLLSSTKLEIKLKHFEYFIKYYHDNLIENLKLLKYPKKLPSLKDIHIAFYRHGVWGFTVATGIMAAVLLDPNDNANIDNFLGDDENGKNFKLLMFSNARYRKHIEVVLPWLYNRGALEC